jgi:hypothetical protein
MLTELAEPTKDAAPTKVKRYKYICAINGDTDTTATDHALQARNKKHDISAKMQNIH